MTRVAVCVITFRRLPGLRRLLDSIAALRFDRVVPEITVCVVDNDPHGGASGLVDGLAPSFPFKLVYARERERGISAARNRAVEVAAGADFVAFVDDDEAVCPGWLEQLLLEQLASGADVVMGPVAPEFEGRPPDWVVRGRFFAKDPWKHGKLDENYGSTANILIRRDLLGDLAEPFANGFNLSGGADYHLILRLKAQGAKVGWAPRAWVTEHVDPGRTTVRWILKRRFRVGNTVAITERSLKPAGWMARPFKGMLRVLQGIFSLPFSWLSGKAGTVRKLGLVFFGCGIVAGFFGYRYREYGGGEDERA